MPKYLLTDAAKADIREIVQYVRQFSPDAAQSVRIRLRAEIRRLAEFPLLGHARSDLATADLRFWSVYSYLIVYRPEARPLQIIRVLHGSRDLPNILQ